MSGRPVCVWYMSHTIPRDSRRRIPTSPAAVGFLQLRNRRNSNGSTFVALQQVRLRFSHFLQFLLWKCPKIICRLNGILLKGHTLQREVHFVEGEFRPTILLNKHVIVASAGGSVDLWEGWQNGHITRPVSLATLRQVNILVFTKELFIRIAYLKYILKMQLHASCRPC